MSPARINASDLSRSARRRLVDPLVKSGQVPNAGDRRPSATATATASGRGSPARWRCHTCGEILDTQADVKRHRFARVAHRIEADLW